MSAWTPEQWLELTAGIMGQIVFALFILGLMGFLSRD
jgi:hypothetical protein